MLNYQELISKALEENFSDIEVIETASETLEISIYNGKVEKNAISTEKTVAVKAIYNTKIAYLNIEDLEIKVEDIISILKKNAEIIQTTEEYEIFAGSDKYPQIEENNFDFSKISGFEKISLLLEIEKEIKAADQRIVVVPHCGYAEEQSAMRIINSKGLDISKKGKYCYIVVQAVASEDGDSKTGFDISIKSRYDEINKKEIIANTVKKAVSMLNAKPVQTKQYPIILENEAMADLLTVYQSIFNGEMAIKKITPLLDKENQLIMDEKITILDDPLKEGAFIQEPFDEEGVACYKKTIVDNGRFVSFMHNLKTAKFFKTKSTGNGFKQGTIKGINFHVKEGETSLEDMILSLDEGILIQSLEGLHSGVNTISGDFSLKASGFYVKNGKIERATTLIVVSGNFLKMMNDVEKIGNDLKINYNGVGSPSILFGSLAISG